MRQLHRSIVSMLYRESVIERPRTCHYIQYTGETVPPPLHRTLQSFFSLFLPLWLVIWYMFAAQSDAAEMHLSLQYSSSRCVTSGSGIWVSDGSCVSSIIKNALHNAEKLVHDFWLSFCFWWILRCSTLHRCELTEYVEEKSPHRFYTNTNINVLIREMWRCLAVGNQSSSLLFSSLLPKLAGNP